MTKQASGSRRDFLKASAVAGGAMAANLSLLSNVHAQGSDTIKVGIIGCGGRGTGAGEDVLQSASNVKIVAIGDAFEDRVRNCQRRLQKFAAGNETSKNHGNSVDLPPERCFVGLDAYEKVIDCDVNYVIQATPPGFRPIHIPAIIAAGKHLFTEKPVGVDGTGIRRVLAAYEEAQRKGLGVAAGTQRRHQQAYIETVRRLHDGEIGDLTGGRCYWNQGILWARPRQPGMTDVQYQVHNWYNFTWLCGDHIVEQHVHNIDVLNWCFRAHPLRAVAMGYRTRTNPDYGHIYDFFATDYEYPNGVHALSMCRHISNCADSVSEAVVGTKGRCQVNEYSINGKRLFTRQQTSKHTNPYIQEHHDLIASIRAGRPINELKQVAESTLAAIMARMSAYTGKEVRWEQALNSKLNLMPEKLTWQTELPTWEVAVPGKTPLV
jgi:predicted dehydrogenase